EHCLEHTHLLRRWSLLRGEPESQLTKGDVPHQLARQIVTKQANAAGIRRPESSGILHLSPLLIDAHGLCPFSLRLLVRSSCAILACGCPGRREVLRVDVWRLAQPGANLLV